MAMKRKRKKHVKGRRGEEFRRKIEGLRPEEIVGVAIDVSKSFHRVMIFDFGYQILREPFEIDVFKTGYERLKTEVKRVLDDKKAKKVFWAMEPTGSYHENLARHLIADGEEVIFINSYQTAANRDQRMLRGLKTDDIDLAAIADLLIRQEGYSYNLEEGVYLELKEKAWWREKKLRMQTMLKNQIRVRMEKTFPGLTTRYNGNKPLVEDLWTNSLARGIMKVGLSGGEILRMSASDLKAIFKQVGHPIRDGEIDELKAYLAKMLLPDDKVARAEIELLKRDVRLLEALEEEMAEVEGKMVERVKDTPGGHLLGKIKGIGEVMIASFIGGTGDITKFERASQIFRKAGLDPKTKQSGEYEAQGLPIRRTGSKLLRCILYKMTDGVIKHNPYFGLYYDYLVERRKKFWKKARIAVSNKLVKVIFALVRDEAEFAPPTAKIDYLKVLFTQAKKERRERWEQKKRRKISSLGPISLGLKATGLGVLSSSQVR